MVFFRTRKKHTSNSLFFAPPQHLVAHQHGSIGRRGLLLTAPHGRLPRGEPHLVAAPPAQLGSGKLRHAVAHQAHAASHGRGRLQDFPRALRQRNPAKAW